MPRKDWTAAYTRGEATGATQCAPKQQHGRDLRGPAPVDAFPKGASPFGVMDLTGNIWQWTDEFQDEHTRAAIAARRRLLPSVGIALVFPVCLQTQ